MAAGLLASNNQEWLGPAAGTKNTILYKGSCGPGGSCTKCLDLAGGDTTNGAPIGR